MERATRESKRANVRQACHEFIEDYCGYKPEN